MTDTERPRATLPGAGRFLSDVEVMAYAIWRMTLPIVLGMGLVAGNDSIWVRLAFGLVLVSFLTDRFLEMRRRSSKEAPSSMPVNFIPIHISSEDAQRLGLSRETERKDPLQ